MEVTIQKYKDEIIGINLISETGFEQDIVQRFWSGGIKINGITSSNILHLTFKDLIGK